MHTFDEQKHLLNTIFNNLLSKTTKESFDHNEAHQKATLQIEKQTPQSKQHQTSGKQ